MRIAFDTSYLELPERLYTRQAPVPVAAPSLIVWNRALATRLGLKVPEDVDALATAFSGNAPPEGATPLAQLYAGHQFGHWNPQLGDGRAVLLGEIVAPDGARFDIQLKGAGRTPYSRSGDGRAALGPVLREYVVSEAMAALGIPTTRALAAVLTGEAVQRETALPGAILTRVARSHIRVGTFQVLAARQDWEGLGALYAHTRDRHYPEAESPAALLAAVAARQARLVAEWLGVGFIHGVMNTDNCTLSGETIDYGPCAFMDGYDPMRVYSSIDRQGRYAYGAQADIIVWNMAQLASALVPLMGERDAAVAELTAVVQALPDRLRAEWARVFTAKIGIATAEPGDLALVGRLLDLMAAEEADFTGTFAALRSGEIALSREEAAAWAKDWQTRIAREDAPEEVMARANPLRIPRNHQVEAMIAAAMTGDFTPFERLNAALARPYEAAPEFADYARAPHPEEEITATFCGT